MKKIQKKYLIIGLVVIVLIFVGLNASNIWDRLSGEDPGKISIFVPVAGSSIYLDGKLSQTTGTKDQTLELNGISSGDDHIIIVSKQGYWPWTKTINVAPGKEADLAAFNEASAETSQVLAPGDQEYASATQALAADAAVPDKAHMIVSKDGNVGIWAEDGKIMAEWIPDNRPDDFFCVDKLCDKDTTIFSGTSPITSVSFYPNRDDIVLFSTGASVYAIEIDRNGTTQNFQPVYTGTAPKIAPSSDPNFIYVKDEGKILKILS